MLQDLACTLTVLDSFTALCTADRTRGGGAYLFSA